MALLGPKPGKLGPPQARGPQPIGSLTNACPACWVRGFPGAAFVNRRGDAVNPDPTVTLTFGASAWSAMTFANPAITAARHHDEKAATTGRARPTEPPLRDDVSICPGRNEDEHNR